MIDTIRQATSLQIAIGIAALLAVALAGALAGAAAWSAWRTSAFERAVEKAKAEAHAKHREAEALEAESRRFREKITHLENAIGEIREIARRQDDELEKLDINRRSARRDVEHARRTRAIAATAAELCAKLETLGHGCR